MFSLGYYEHHASPSLLLATAERRGTPVKVSCTKNLPLGEYLLTGTFIHLGGFLLHAHQIKTEVHHDLSSKWFKSAVFGLNTNA